jgi:hypothetical protein
MGDSIVWWKVGLGIAAATVVSVLVVRILSSGDR